MESCGAAEMLGAGQVPRPTWLYPLTGLALCMEGFEDFRTSDPYGAPKSCKRSLFWLKALCFLKLPAKVEINDLLGTTLGECEGPLSPSARHLRRVCAVPELSGHTGDIDKSDTRVPGRLIHSFQKVETTEMSISW